MRRYIVERMELGEWEPCWGAEFWNKAKAIRRGKMMTERGKLPVRVWDSFEEREVWPKRAM